MLAITVQSTFALTSAAIADVGPDTVKMLPPHSESELRAIARTAGGRAGAAIAVAIQAHAAALTAAGLTASPPSLLADAKLYAAIEVQVRLLGVHLPAYSTALKLVPLMSAPAPPSP